MAVFQSVKPQWKRGLIAKLLSCLNTAAVPPLLGAPVNVHLYSGNIAISQDTLLAAFTAIEASFTGYAPQLITLWKGPFNTGANTQALTNSQTFSAGAPLVQGGTVNGYWVDYGTTLDWMIAEVFPQPIPFANAGDFLQLLLQAPMASLMAVNL